MNTEEYRQRLQAQEQELLTRTNRARANAREPGDNSAHDVGDESVTDHAKAEQFTEAEADRTLLTQVQDALRRIDDGTFGTCLVDGEPLEEKRLQAMPWAPYCLKHQELLEAANPVRRPTS